MFEISRTENRGRIAPQRRGTATVELALCLPLIVLVAFGTVEGASMIFLKQTLVQTAYEGTKVAIHRNATNDDVNAAIQSVLDGRSLTGVTVEFNPTNIRSARRGDLVTIRVMAPSDANSIFPFGPFKGHLVSGRAVMVKE